MNSLEVRKHIQHDWTELFRLVCAIESYPQFVPCCQRTAVLTRSAQGPDTTVIDARMTVGLSALHVSYTTRTIADHSTRMISLDSIDGPLRQLRAAWTFDPDTDGGTEVGFRVEYEFESPMLGALASNLFDAMFRQMLDALERRADHVSGGFGVAAVRAVPHRTARGARAAVAAR